jgi:hypothetical protein
MKKRPTYKYEKLRAELSGRNSLRICRWLLLFIFLAGGALWFVRLKKETELTRSRVSELERKQELRVKELENLKMQQETLTGRRYIGYAVKRMGLDLRETREGQVRRMVVRRTPPDGVGEGESLVAARER